MIYIVHTLEKRYQFYKAPVSSNYTILNTKSEFPLILLLLYTLIFMLIENRNIKYLKSILLQRVNNEDLKINYVCVECELKFVMS